MKKILLPLFPILTVVSASAADPFWYKGELPPTNRAPVAVSTQASATAFDSRIVSARESDPFDFSTFPIGFLLFLR